MRGRATRTSIRWLLVVGLALSAWIGADAASAEPYAVGDTIAPFTLEDQHGESRSVDASVNVILFSRDPTMRGRPYSMLLDREGETTARLPDAAGQATLILVDQLTVQRIVHVAEAPAVRRELESASPRD